MHMSDREEIDPVIEVSKTDVDGTLLRESLKLSPLQRLQKLQAQYDFWQKMRAARKVELER